MREAPSTIAGKWAFRLYGEGYRFLLPYLGLYVVFWALRLPVPALRVLFLIGHAANLFLLGVYLKERNFPKRELLFWGGLFALLAINGAYLEAPSDPWDYLRLIYFWDTLDLIPHHPSPQKFSFFFSWSLLGGIPIPLRRSALDLYSGLVHGLLLLQFYLFCLRLGFDSAWSKIQTLAMLLLFGTNLFGFRYYALGSTPFAYIGYLRALIVLLDWNEGKSKALSKIWLPVALIVFNHLEELFALGVCGTAIAVYHLHVGELRHRREARLLRYTFWSATVALLTGALFFPHFFLRGVRHILPLGLRWLPFAPRSWEQIGNVLVWERFLPVFQSRSVYLQTYGVHGILGLGLSLLLWKRQRMVAVLSLAPTLVLLSPPFALAAAAWLDPYVTYRILYAFPTSVPLVAGIQLCLGYLPLKKGAQLAAALVLVGALSVPKDYPWRGRGWFEFYRPPAILSLEPFDELAVSLERARPSPQFCAWWSDPATYLTLQGQLSYYLYRLPGTRPRHFLLPSPRTDNRREPLSLFHEPKSPAELSHIIEYYQVCRILIVDQEKYRGRFPDIVESTVGKSSGHWDAAYVRKSTSTVPGWYGLIDELRRAGWIFTPVPPFYVLMTAPGVK